MITTTIGTWTRTYLLYLLYVVAWILQMGRHGSKLPSTRNVHEPHSNSYGRKHQQGCYGTDKQGGRSWTNAHAWEKNSHTCLLENLGSIVEDPIYARELQPRSIKFINNRGKTCNYEGKNENLPLTYMLVPTLKYDQKIIMGIRNINHYMFTP